MRISLLSILIIFAIIRSENTLCSLEQRLFLPPSMKFNQGHIIHEEKEISLSPANSVIFFDWDGVMVASSMKERLSTVIESPFQTFKFILGNLIGIIIPNYIFTAVKNNPTTAEAIARNINKIDPALARFILQLGNVNHPQKGMVEIVNQLKKLNYDLSIATNKEVELFALEYKKAALNALYNLFPKALIVDQQNSATTLVVPDSNFIVKKSATKKPAVDYYNKAEQEFNSGNKYILFIDDNVTNFDPIHINGDTGIKEIQRKDKWIGLKFENPKQLKEDLIALGILSSKSDSVS